jgi:carboxylesterase
VVDTIAIMPGAEAWSAPGEGERATVGVVVTHGFTGNPLATRPLGEELHRAGYSVSVPRLPGHGTSVKDMARTRYPEWRAEVERALDEQLERCEQVVLVGHSMGGTITLDVASRRPDDVTSAVVINPQVLDPDQALAKVAPILQYVLPVVPRDLAGLPSDDIAKPGVDEGAYPKVPAKAAQSLIRELPRIRAQLLDLTCPLLVVVSPQDHTVDPKNARAVQEFVASPDITEVVCERSYHVPMLDWDADLVTTEVLAFVARTTCV